MKRMFKEILVVLVAAVILISLSGCARVNYEVNINKDGSADVSYIMGYDKEFLNSMGVTEEDLGDGTFDDMKSDAAEDGYQIEDYSDDSIKGFKANKHFDEISDFKMDEVGDTDLATEDKNNEITFKKVLLNTKISQNAKLDLTEINSQDDDSEVSSIMNMLLGQMKFSYKITLPFKVGDNNATTVSEDGKTLEWTLTPGEVNEVYFEAQNNLNTVVLECIVCAVVLVIVVIIVIATKSKKSDKKEVKVAPNKTTTNTEKKDTVKKEENTENKEVKPAQTKKEKSVKEDKEEKKDTKEKPKKDDE